MIDVEVQYDLIIPKYEMPFRLEHWQKIGEIVKLNIQAGIMNQVDVTGQAYPPLTPMTIMGKREGSFTGQSKGKTSTSKKQFKHTVWGDAERVAPGFRKERTLGQYQSKRLMRTGNLLMNQKIAATRTQVEISIGPERAEIGRYQQEGIKAHTITAGAGKAIPLHTENGMIFVKSVQHPGTAPVPFFGISAPCIAQIDKYLEIEFDKWLRDV